MKKLISLVLALCMVLMVGVALAQEVPTGKGGTASITITNAAKEEDYKLFKIFDATADANGNIAYTGTIPSALADYFIKDSADNILVKTDDEGHPTHTETGIAQAVAEYVNGLAETDSGYITKATGDGTAVVFTGLQFGYYGVTSSQGAVVTVDSTNPNAIIRDKNTVTTEAVKKVNGKDVEDVYVGETVTFTAKFGPLANWIQENNVDYQVKSYTIADTLPEYLTDVAITGVVIYDGDPDANPAGVQKDDLSSTYTAFTNKKIVIPWVNDANPAANLYANKSYIKITYTAKVGAMAVIDGNGNRNDITITPNKDKTGGDPFEEHTTDHAEVKTYGTALIKVDGKDQTKTLKGAKFTIDGFEVVADGEPGVYRVTGAKNGASIEMDTNNDGELYILGVKDTVSATETVAPAGYNKLTAAVSLPKQTLNHTIWTKDEDRYFDAKGNLVSASSSETTTTAVSKNYTDLKPAAVKVLNNVGAELPSTGGIGTTIFYIVGGLLLVGAAIVLVARRKAEN